MQNQQQRLVEVWQEHTRSEFEKKDVDATMVTMVAQPCVNNLPTQMGASGYENVYKFYKYQFISKLPKDVTITLLSRTVGETSLVDEIVFSCTHDTEIDFMLPNVPPTGKKIEIPLVVIVYFDNGKIAREHIYWDQASVLVQIGLLNTKQLPIVGVEQARSVKAK